MYRVCTQQGRIVEFAAPVTTPIWKGNSVMNSFLGSLLLVPYNFAPQGWAFCQGQLMNISQTTDLFSLIGNTYGGAGVTTFALPNLPGPKDASGAALNCVIALEGIYPSRD